jgi:hypothetical protein
MEGFQMANANNNNPFDGRDQLRISLATGPIPPQLVFGITL